MRRKHEFFKSFSIRRFDFILVVLVIALNVIGIRAVGSAAPDLKMRQIYGSVIGMVLMLFVSSLDYTKLLKLYVGYYVLNIVLLLMVLLVGTSGGGAQRWIAVGPVTFQPSEAAKILLILFYAKFIMKYKNRAKSQLFYLICFLLVLPSLALILRQPDLSTTVMVFLIFTVMIFVAGLSYKFVLGVLVITIPTVLVFLNMVTQEGSTILQGYQRGRFLAWFHPEDYQDTIAYQTMNSLMAIGSGQLTGKGYNTNEFSSLLNSGYISQSQTDFIFTVVGEELGFIGASTVVILLVLIAVKCLANARSAKDEAGAVIAAGVGAWIGFQGFLNIGVATGVVPNTGIPLPFVSYGLTSLVCLYVGIGLVLNVRMQSKQPGSNGK